MQDDNVKPKLETCINHTSEHLINKGLHNNLRGVLIMSQIFGLLPAQGIAGLDSSNLRFVWRSKRVIYTALLTLVSFFVALMAVFHMLYTGAQLRNITVAIFYGIGFLVNLLFLKVARNWNKLISKWENVETSMTCYGYPKNLPRNIIVITAAVLLAATFEHVLSVVKSINHVRSVVKREEYSLVEELINIMFAFIIDYIPYSLPLAVLLLAVNAITQFSWNFMDLFIMVMSTALAERFRQITMRIKSASKTQRDGVDFWRNVREDYNRLCSLLKQLENELSVLICVSFASNLGLILIQLFQSLHPRSSGFENIYFFSCFGLLILRTVGVTILAARVNDESKGPLPFLADVSSDIYCNEVERLIGQIYYNNVALTGCKIFSITRGLICSMGGTIVTYELLLFQFNVSITI